MCPGQLSTEQAAGAFVLTNDIVNWFLGLQLGVFLGPQPNGTLRFHHVPRAVPGFWVSKGLWVVMAEKGLLSEIMERHF